MQRRAALSILAARTRCGRGLLLALCGLALAGASAAQPVPAQPMDPIEPAQAAPLPAGSTWLAASDGTLASLRGGFDLGAGVLVSFGISRAVRINGELVTTASFQLGDLGRLSAAQAQLLGQQLGVQAQLVQNGPGNHVDAQAAAAAPLATYIQNTLSDQRISSQTVIQATSSGLSMVRGLNLQSTLSESLSQAIGHR